MVSVVSAFITKNYQFEFSANHFLTRDAKKLVKTQLISIFHKEEDFFFIGFNPLTLS